MLFEPLFTHARREPQHVAIIDDQGQHSYQQLAGLAARLGASLSSWTKQPRVGLLLPPGAGFAGTFYGTLLAGKAAVPINYLLSEREVVHIIRDSGIDTVVTAPMFAARLAALSLNVVVLSTLVEEPSAPAVSFPTRPPRMWPRCCTPAARPECPKA